MLTVDEVFSSIRGNADYGLLEKILCLTHTPNFITNIKSELLKMTPDLKSLKPKSEHIDDAVESKDNYDSKQIVCKPLRLELLVTGNSVTFDNLFCSDDLDAEKFMRYSCTNFKGIYPSTSANLVQLIDGSVVLLEANNHMVKSNIVAVLQFSPIDCKLSYLVGEAEPITVPTIDFVTMIRKGFCVGCSNLVFVPAIPEGVRDLSEAFKGCSKLNCPLYLPRTVTDCTGMLDGCENFKSTIFVYGNDALERVKGLRACLVSSENNANKSQKDHLKRILKKTFTILLYHLDILFSSFPPPYLLLYLFFRLV